MTADTSLVLGLETRMMNAWPALETQIVDGWVVRLANGYSRRANSASAIAVDAPLSAPALAHMVRLFDGAGVRPVIRITPLCATAVDPGLAAAGWREEVPTQVMVAPLHDRTTIDADVTLETRASDLWIAANAASYGGEKANADHLKAILERIRPTAAFATLDEKGAPAAWGVAVAERGFVALQDLVVEPNARGRGIGRRLTAALMAWGARAGAARAYLQVRDDNRIAIGLYASLGFVAAYRYSHRVRA